MRIALVETAPLGGLLHYAAQLADGLAASGDQVDLIVTRGNELAGRAGAARMRAILTPAVKDAAPPPSRGFGRLIRRAGIGLRLGRSWLEIIRATRGDRYELVVVNSDIYYSVAALGMCALTLMPGAPPVVFICHNARPFSRGDGEGLTRSTPGLQGRLLRRLFPRLLLILLHGEKSRAEFEAAWPTAELATIPHGDERLFADTPPPPSAEERILFFGNWRKVKGISVLMEAFDRIAARRPEATLTLAGAPFPEDLDPAAVRRWAARHDGKVEVLDNYVPMPEVPAVFGRARVVALPYLEAFQSGVVHLAMTMERAVVATRVGDLPSVVIANETGLLVPPGDVEALAGALERILADPGTAARMGKAGRERVFGGSSWESVAERFDTVVTAALERRA